MSLSRALVLSLAAFGAVAACSSESTTVIDTSKSCEDVECPTLTCTCSGLSGAEVRVCTEGVCAETCEEAGCE